MKNVLQSLKRQESKRKRGEETVHSFINTAHQILMDLVFQNQYEIGQNWSF